MSFPQIGQILPNGHTVDAAYCVGDARYVLAHGDGAPESYVVWDVDQDGDTVNGRYFADPAAAQKKFSQCCFDWREESSPEQSQCSDEDTAYLRELEERAVAESFTACGSDCQQPILETAMAEFRPVLQRLLSKYGIPEHAVLKSDLKEAKDAFYERKKREIAAAKEHLNQYL